MSEQHFPTPQPPERAATADIRRPTLFAANAALLAASMGLALMPLAVPWLRRLLTAALPGISTEELLLLAALVYYLPFSFLPCVYYAHTRRVWAAMRFTEPLSPSAAVYSVMAAIVSLPLGSNIALLWSAALQRLGLTLPAQPPPKISGNAAPQKTEV